MVRTLKITKDGVKELNTDNDSIDEETEAKIKNKVKEIFDKR